MVQVKSLIKNSVVAMPWFASFKIKMMNKCYLKGLCARDFCYEAM